jgi:hypothetical protein
MKPLLVGEMNPYSSLEQYDLWPHPEGCSGHRLCHAILEMTEEQYLAAFDRLNLVRGRDWCPDEARFRAATIRHDRIILLGAKVCRAFELGYQAFRTTAVGTKRILMLPHPSGLNRQWNDPHAAPAAREAVRIFAPEVYE